MAEPSIPSCTPVGSPVGPPATNNPNMVPDGLEAVPSPHYPEVVPYAKENYYTPSSGPHSGFSPNPHSALSPGQQAPTPQYAPPISSPEKKILGLRRTTFILVLLLLLVIIGGGVGGGVGGSMAVNSAYDRGLKDGSSGTGSTSGSSPTPTGLVAPPPTTGSLELDCPNLNDTTQQVSPDNKIARFRTTCGVNYSSAQGSTDITVLPAYSYRDCMLACAAFNNRGKVPDLSCVAVQFNSKIDNIGRVGGNCWLKSTLGDVSEKKSKPGEIAGELL